MAWFAMHCPTIIQLGEESSETVRFAHLHRFEKSQWERTYITGIRKLIRRYDAYSFFRCFPSILGTGYSEKFHDVRNGRSSLGQGIFK